MTVKIDCAYDQLVEVEKLVPNPRNNNRHSIEQIEALSKLIKAHGFRHALVVSNRSGFIVAGHGRLEAARKLGIEKLPVDFQDFSSEAEEYQCLTADNEIARWAELDYQNIYDTLKELPDVDVSLLGIEDFKLPEEEVIPQCDEDEVPEAPPIPKTKRGDIFELGNHRLMCGDSTMIDDIEKLMNDEKADMVFTDPPYSLTGGGRKGNFVNSGWMSPDKFKDKSKSNLFDVPEFSAWVANFPVFLKEISEVFVMSNVRNLKELMEEIEKTEAKIHNILIMNKNTSFPHIWYSTNSEFVLYYYYGKAIDPIKKCQSNVFDVKMPRGEEKQHVSQKPVEFISDIISNHQGKLVFEPFCGSGSTLVACEKTNRKCYGMELDEKYCDVIINRWQKFTGKKAYLLKDNEKIEFDSL